MDATPATETIMPATGTKEMDLTGPLEITLPDKTVVRLRWDSARA